MTWVRHPHEELLVRGALRRLAELGLPTVITDGGSPPEFLAHLKSFDGFYVRALGRPGVVAQTRASMEVAYQRAVPLVLYTESDKQWFFEHQLEPFLAAAPDADDVGVVFPVRSAASFATYPASQRYAETVTNHLYAEVTGIETDYLYGPVLLNRARRRSAGRESPPTCRRCRRWRCRRS